MSESHSLRLDGPILQAMLDLLPGTLHVKDRALRYCIVNRGYLERWGARAEDVIGKTSEEVFGDLFGAGPDERNREVFTTGKAVPFYEVSYPNARGGRVVLWSTKVPLLDENGVVTHVLTFSLDITPLKSAQAELDRQRQALLQSERMSVLGTLAAGISHELRNPLTVVISQAKLLEDELTARKPRDRVAAIARAAERCAAIVTSFLDQARAGPRRTERFSIRQVIDSARGLTAHVLHEEGVTLTAGPADSAIAIEGDPHQLSQVLINLLLNAVAAMRTIDAPRRISITTRIIDGNRVELAVGDCGPGVPTELQGRVFERFFTTKPMDTGTGLGLAICRDIVTAHGGEISVGRSPLGGAQFAVVLPLSRGPG